MKTREEKLKIINETISSMNKKHGDGTIMRLGENSFIDIPVEHTGSISLDRALGVGGLPRGRIIEIYGPESSGKTTLCLQCIAEIQKNGGIAAFIDAEHAFDKTYAEKLGINTDEMLISQPNNGEEGLQVAEELIKTGEIDIVVIDSVAALIPKAELDGDIGDCRPGLHARLMSQALRKMTGVISNTKCVCIFINQIRNKIGVTFGSPETTTGGNALKFFSSIRLDIRKISAIKNEAGDIIGNKTCIKVVKNKVAPPFRTAYVDIIFGEGVDKYGEIIDIGIETGIIKKNGAWLYYEGTKLAQGRECAINKLKKDEKTFEEIKNKINKNKPTKAE